MSSFVIEKKEYVKAAGLVAGIAESKEIWFYSYKVQRNRKAEDYYNDFVECFEMNALSVQEQYKDSDAEFDSNTYMDTFQEYKKIGKKACFNYRDIVPIAVKLTDFFSSAIYQTEKESYMYKMQMFFNAISTKLFMAAYPHECECWGDLNI